MRGSERPPFLKAEDTVERALPVRLVVALALFDLVDLSLARLEPLGHGPADAVLAPALPRRAQLERLGRLSEDKDAARGEVVSPERVRPRVVLQRALVDVDDALERLAAVAGRETVAEEHALDGARLAARRPEGLVDLFLDDADVGLPARERVWVAEEVVLGCEVLGAEEARVRDERRRRDRDGQHARQVAVRASHARAK